MDSFSQRPLVLVVVLCLDVLHVDIGPRHRHPYERRVAGAQAFHRLVQDLGKVLRRSVGAPEDGQQPELEAWFSLSVRFHCNSLNFINFSRH